MLLAVLVAILLGKLLTGKRIKPSNKSEWVVMTAGEGMMATSREQITIRARQNF